MDTLIIGCGAAGAAAAIAAARCGESVTVIDRNRKPLKKLGVTGNGRGNLLNSSALRYYGDVDFAHQVLSRRTPEQLAQFLEACGISLTQEEEGRMYPAAGLASVAVDGLLARLERLGVRVLTGVTAERIIPGKNGFTVETTVTEYAPDQQKANGKTKKGEALHQRRETFQARRVIVTVGGAAAPAHGTDGTAYSLLTDLGHTLRTPRPALCALLTETQPLKGLSGKRVKAKLSLRTAEGNMLHESSGEALFADDGVSGIAAMQLARFVKPGCRLHMDLRQALLGDENADAADWLCRRRHTMFGDRAMPAVADLLTGCTHPSLTAALCRMAKLSETSPATEPVLSQLGAVITDFSLAVTGTRGFDQAQVTAGGLDTAQFDPVTLESRLIPGLYAAGEVLDVDGDCGGYNLMFAFATGLLAGDAASSNDRSTR